METSITDLVDAGELSLEVLYGLYIAGVTLIDEAEVRGYAYEIGDADIWLIQDGAVVYDGDFDYLDGYESIQAMRLNLSSLLLYLLAPEEAQEVSENRRSLVELISTYRLEFADDPRSLVMLDFIEASQIDRIREETQRQRDDAGLLERKRRRID